MVDKELKTVINNRGGSVEVVISGIISELATLEAADIPAGIDVIIDCGGVLSINSFGVRTWVNYLDAVCDKATSVRLRRMAPALVAQASMISNFLSGARVESFFTPWCCTKCEHETVVLYGIDDEVPHEGTCPECEGETEFDEIRESYLAFRESLAS